MTRKKSPVHIIDACTYFYLRCITLNGDKTLYDYVKNNFKIAISPTVQNEINRNLHKYKNFFTESSADALKRGKCVERNAINFHTALFTHTPSNLGDEGEKENFSLALQMLRNDIAITYISDDLNAVGNDFGTISENNKTLAKLGHLNQHLLSFPFFSVWTSFDCVLYLRFRGLIAQDIAQTAIINLNAFFFKNDTEYQNLQEKKKNSKISNDEYASSKNKIQTKHTARKLAYMERLSLIEQTIM